MGIANFFNRSPSICIQLIVCNAPVIPVGSSVKTWKRKASLVGSQGISQVLVLHLRTLPGSTFLGVNLSVLVHICRRRCTGKEVSYHQ